MGDVTFLSELQEDEITSLINERGKELEDKHSCFTFINICNVIEELYLTSLFSRKNLQMPYPDIKKFKRKAELCPLPHITRDHIQTYLINHTCITDDQTFMAYHAVTNFLHYFAYKRIIPIEDITKILTESPREIVKRYAKEAETGFDFKDDQEKEVFYTTALDSSL